MRLISTNFEFLKGKNDDFYDLACKMEDSIYSVPGNAIQNGGVLFDNMVDLSCEKANMNMKKENSYFKITNLFNKRIIDYDTYLAFDKARKERNKAIHREANEINAVNLNRVLYKAISLFYKRFYDSDFEIPDYIFPEKPSDTEINNDMGKTIGEIEVPITYYNLSKLNGSYLINELSKLSISSKYSIEDSDGLDAFKEYMHVERDIQTEFHETLNRVKDSNSNQLILLAGSVGDGKSHLLAYMSNKYPDVMRNFKVHNDATESFDPNLTAIDTLRSLLEPFNDKNIGSSDDKIVLAINLGIIRGLLDDEEFGQNFSILKEELENSNIFNSDIISNEKETSDFLDIINFSDNHLYELKEEHVESKFLSDLFDKIVLDSQNNPFYLAYVKDKQEGISNPIISNYEMFRNKDVRDRIIQILLKYIIKNKKLLSTREIINFIYEILVPPIIKENYDMGQIPEYIDDLLPILLFNTVDRSKILNEISEDSPLNVRNKFLDEFLVSLNTLEISSFVDEYFDEYDEIMFLKDYLRGLEYQTLENNEKQELKDKLIFFAVFFGSEDVIDSFKDEKYENFLKFLYFYNYSPNKLNKLFNNIKKSIFRWKGSIKKDYILIDELDNFKLGKRMNIGFNHSKNVSDDENKNKFKTNIQFNFLANDDDCDDRCNGNCGSNKCVKLDIDYFLFDSIIKISEGYQPNKSEKQDLMVFNDFINNLIQKNKNKQILIKDDKNEEYFKFNLSSGYYYNFERE